ncbi:tRNA-uridine aminocarboxypropyltransferase [Achromobacter piechaudii]|uniref:tRNA-uridine aminocarboxypropyltransferase n=1 Tax=Achromobacter piechaudii ATCC 43553 TaxID=742159 RepID=D4XA73_9BURK|nr:DTW domain-containing protein [Achromobacter piechaudii]EFF76338.1 DTW domain protein [Achromobacter piechaudii ATCC 43553]
MSRTLCTRCLRPESHCLCALIPSLSCRTRVVVLQHPSEARHALNTARLAVLGLRDARRVVGERFTPSDWVEPGYTPRLLFPGPDAQVLGPGCGRDIEQPIQLIVPDGTWGHARKLLHINPELAALPRVMLPAGLKTRYRVRHADIDGALSTIEAVTHALNAIEFPTNVDALLRPFEALIDGQIEGMGADLYARHHLQRKVPWR